MMDAPHVVALEYVIEYGPDIDWTRAAPLHIQEAGFNVRIENERVRFSFKEHRASEEGARSAVEKKYIPDWEFVVGLEQVPNAFKLRFDHSETVGRNPPPGPRALSVH